MAQTMLVCATAGEEKIRGHCARGGVHLGRALATITAGNAFWHTLRWP